jgi:taurine dioxygenase
MKHYLEGLEAEHDGEHVYRGLFSNLGVADKPVYPRAIHPVIRIQESTGRKSIYVNRGFTTRILGIPADESSAVLRYLFEHCESPLWQCRFRWESGSVAFWDNRTVQHRAMWWVFALSGESVEEDANLVRPRIGNCFRDYWPAVRSGHRVTIKGKRPVGPRESEGAAKL